jgi:hypothetical protein
MKENVGRCKGYGDIDLRGGGRSLHLELRVLDYECPDVIT